MTDYAINIFEDGRGLFQSLRCPRDRALHAKKLSPDVVRHLIDAFESAQLELYRPCYAGGTGGDGGPREVLAFYHGAQRAVLVGDALVEEVRELEDRVDSALGTGQWIPDLQDEVR